MEFTLKQLSWIVIGSLGIGGSGYMTMKFVAIAAGTTPTRPAAPSVAMTITPIGA